MILQHPLSWKRFLPLHFVKSAVQVKLQLRMFLPLHFVKSAVQVKLQLRILTLSQLAAISTHSTVKL